MRHVPTISHGSQITQPQDVEYIVLPSDDTKAKNFWGYIHIIRKRKWLVIMPLVIILPLAAVYLISKKPIYEATSTLIIDRVNPHVIGIAEVTSPEYTSDDPDFFRTQYELIKSPLVLEKVVDAFNLVEDRDVEKGIISHTIHMVKHFVMKVLTTNSANSPVISTSTPIEKTSSYEDLRQKAVSRLQGRLEIKPKLGTLLVDISLRGTDPVGVIHQVNMISESYMQQNLDNRMEAATKAVVWLGQREGELKDKISKLETELQIYKEEKKIVYLDQFEEYQNPIVQKLNSLQSPIISIASEKERLMNDMKSIRELSKNDIGSLLGALPDQLNTPAINSLKNRYAELRTQYHSLSKIYGNKHPSILRIDSEISELGNLIHEEVNKQLYTMDKQYKNLLALEKSLEERVDEQSKDFIQLSNDIQKYNELKSELGIDKGMLLTVSKRLAETTLTKALETNNVRSVKMASVSTEAEPHSKKVIAIVSFVTSLGLGIGLALIRENLDKQFRSVDEAEQYLGIVFLGIVPGYKIRNSKLVALYNPEASASEAYRTVRTWIRLSSEGGFKTLLITSALAGEGKSQTAANLAVSFAQLGQNVLLVDADLRRPQLHRTFNLVNSEGLIDILVRGTGWPSVLRATDMENLKVLPTGGIPHNPTELLSMTRMQNLLASAKDAFDLIIVDAPVTLAIPDVAILVPEMDAVLLVHDPVKGEREVVLEAKKLLDRARANLVGIIFNNVRVKKQMRYQHTSEYHKQAYSHPTYKQRQQNLDVSFIDMRPKENYERQGMDT